jgi:transcriptional regulator with XRE-family HTH domain
MPQTVLPDLNIALTVLRLSQGWSQADLGKAAGISPKIVNEYERGRKVLTRKRLEYLIAFMGLSAERIDAVLDFLAANRAAGRPPWDSADPRSETLRQVEVLVARCQKVGGGVVRSILSLLTVEGEALQARQRAGFLWDRLKRRTPAERKLLVEHDVKLRSWALCERVASESIKAAPNHPKQALELAELAQDIAERIPGEMAWRSRVQGYAGLFVGNARRVCNDLPGADEAFARARKLWEAGAPGDLGLLNEAWLPGLEAALRRDQRRFPEALKRIDEALALDAGKLRGEILIIKAGIHDALGSPESSTAALLEAAPLINVDQEPRLAFGLRFNLMADLCQLNKFVEAEPRLREVRALAERLGEELDLTRVVWLEGKVAAGLGRLGEAQADFERARRVFHRRELSFDYALVSLELALLLLEQGRTAEVSTLAGEMLWIFQSQGVEREALAAIRLFCDAAKRETATVELARQVVKFLYRAQHDPELRFVPENGAEAR